MLLCSVPGYDVSGRVDDLVAQTNKAITSIALGSAEGFSEAEKVINASVKSGRFVFISVLQNWVIISLHSMSEQ